MNASSCALIDRDEIAALYVANRLEERDDFELHLLSCASCREQVREAAVIHQAFRLRRRRRQLAVFVPATTAIAAGIAWLIFAPGSLEKLGRVGTPPSLVSMAVRTNADSATQFAEQGMQAYRSRDYDEAARLLSRARHVEEQPAVVFFLGAAQLMAGRPDSATAAFRAVLAAGSSVYTREAHYYAAKAWLQLGEPDSATAHLRVIGERALLDSISAAR